MNFEGHANCGFVGQGTTRVEDLRGANCLQNIQPTSQEQGGPRSQRTPPPLCCRVHLLTWSLKHLPHNQPSGSTLTALLVGMWHRGHLLLQTYFGNTHTGSCRGSLPV